MKTVQERSEQMVSVKKVGERGHLMIQYREAALVVKDVPCSDPHIWLSLQEEARNLRAAIQAALNDYAEEIFAAKMMDGLSSELQTAATVRQANSAPYNRDEVGAGNQQAEEGPRGKLGRILYGLPCARCGAYFDSELAVCPFCSRQPSPAESAPQSPGEEQCGQEPFTLQ